MYKLSDYEYEITVGFGPFPIYFNVNVGLRFSKVPAFQSVFYLRHMDPLFLNRGYWLRRVLCSAL